MGIGVHFGSAIVGPIGHSSKRQLTAIGDSVNVASRIEAATKTLGATLLVSDEVMYFHLISCLRMILPCSGAYIRRRL
jgi:adenylate cyclase